MTNAKEWAVKEQIKHRTWRVRDAIRTYEQLSALTLQALQLGNPYTPEQQRVNSAKDGALESILEQANHLYRALSSDALAPELRRGAHQTIDREIRQQVRVLRNLRTHWDENQQFWTSDAPVPRNGRHWSALWYKERFPDATPWSSSWSKETGHTIGGILSLTALERELDKVETLLSVGTGVG